MTKYLCSCGSIFDPNNIDGECNSCQIIDDFVRNEKPITIMSVKKVDDDMVKDMLKEKAVEEKQWIK